MNTMIELEQANSKDYKLERDDNGLLDLTLKNVWKVEAMILENRAYRRANGNEAKNDKEASAHWFTRLDEVVGMEKAKLTTFCNNLVITLDSENSTHLNTRKDKKTNLRGRDIMVSRVVNLLQNFEEFKGQLRKGDASLIGTLACPNGDYTGRELSFASKFCHYAAFGLFEGKESADKYSIFDRIVSEALADYAIKYCVNNDLIKKYQTKLGEYHTKSKKVQWKENVTYIEFYELYRNLIDAIREKAQKKHGGQMISRNGFDHLLWYAS